MVAFDDRAIHLAHTLHAFLRVRVVTDYVAETNKLRALSRARISQDCLKRLEVGMNVTEDCESHRTIS